MEREPKPAHHGALSAGVRGGAWRQERGPDPLQDQRDDGVPVRGLGHDPRGDPDLVQDTSFVLTADLTVTEEPANGVLIAQGGRFAGWSLYLVDGQVSFCHNLCGLERYYVRGHSRVGPGAHQIVFHFAYDGGGTGRGGTGRLTVDGRKDGTGRIDRTVPFFFSPDETLDVGRDSGTPVTEEYVEGSGNAFSGTLARVRVDLIDDYVPPPDEELMRAALTVH